MAGRCQPLHTRERGDVAVLSQWPADGLSPLTKSEVITVNGCALVVLFIYCCKLL